MAEKGGKASGTGVKTVPMRLFATWEVEKSSPNCIPRLCSLTLTRLVVLKPLENELSSIIIAVKMQSSKRTLRSNEIMIPANGLLDTEIDLSFSLQYPHFLKREGNKLQIMIQRRKKYKNRTILGYKTLAIGQVNMAQVLQRAVDRELNLYSDVKERTNVVAQVMMLALSSQPVDHEENGNPKIQTGDGVMYQEYRSPDVDITDDDEPQDEQEYWSGDEMSDSEPTPESNTRTRNRKRTREQIPPVIQRMLVEDLSDNDDFGYEEKRIPPGRKHSRGQSSSSGQRNFKQKFIALLRRFKMSEEVLDSEQDAELVDNEHNQQEIEDLFDELEDLSDSGPEIDNLSVLSTPKPSLRPFFTGRGSQSDILEVPKDSGRLSDESSKRNDSDRENLSDHELSDSQMVLGSSSNAPARDKDDRPPRKVLLENLSVILSSDDVLPDHVILVNTAEWQGQLLAQILENTQHKVICTCSAADVKATISYLVTKIQKFCNSNSKAPAPIKIAVAGGDGYINSVLRPYVEQFSLKSPDWQHYIKFLVIPLGNSLIGKYVGCVDSVYNGLFVESMWKDAFDKAENVKPDVNDILSRISKYINGATSVLQIPIAEVMITYKEKTMDEESSQNFVPFINEVRIGQQDLCGTSSSVDLDDGALSPPGNLSSSPPTSSPLEKMKESQHTPPSSPNVNSTNPAPSPSMVTTPTAVGPMPEYMDLQLDYWTMSPKSDSSEKEKSGKKDSNKNSLKTAFKSVSVHRLPQKPQNGEPVSSSLSMAVITKEKKQKGQYQFSVMRLGKKSKDVESKSQVMEGISRLICTSKSQNNPLTVTIDGVEWAGVKFFQLSSQWQTHIKQFPVAVFGLNDFTC